MKATPVRAKDLTAGDHVFLGTRYSNSDEFVVLSNSREGKNVQMSVASIRSNGEDWEEEQRTYPRGTKFQRITESYDAPGFLSFIKSLD